MIGNSDFDVIAKVLMEEGRKISLYPHVNIDGDALGSCVALSYALTELNKECSIVLTEDLPDNLKFLDEKGLFSRKINKGEVIDSDISIIVDSGELKRIPGREDCFLNSKIKICIDHHGTSEAFCDYNYIDPKAAATGQLIWKLIGELKKASCLEFKKETKAAIADALFAAITTDTGDFQYSNTQKESHVIVAELYDWGLNANKVSVEIYQSNRVERLKLTAEVLSQMELICDGRVAIAYCSQEMLKKTGAKMEETEWIASDLRGIKGVEVAVFLKEESLDSIKVSLRSKERFDVAELAGRFDGGGHIRASGYTVNCKLDDAIRDIKNELINNCTFI